MTAMDAADRFAALVAALSDEPGVSPPGAQGHRGFGADALTVDGSIFAMVVKGALVLKLPASRVAELVGSGAGTPFSSGSGRPMREWAALVGPDPRADLRLAHESLEHVRSRPSRA
jgi:TfoX/Sxy family transcriptional regulator of competence genes